MKIRIGINKVDAFRAGKDWYGLTVVEVPASRLTTNERELLLHYFERCPDPFPRVCTHTRPAADFYIDFCRAGLRRHLEQALIDAHLSEPPGPGRIVGILSAMVALELARPRNIFNGGRSRRRRPACEAQAADQTQFPPPMNRQQRVVDISGEPLP